MIGFGHSPGFSSLGTVAGNAEVVLVVPRVPRLSVGVGQGASSKGVALALFWSP